MIEIEQKISFFIKHYNSQCWDIVLFFGTAAITFGKSIVPICSVRYKYIQFFMGYFIGVYIKYIFITIYINRIKL